ncbi:hypothetical protein FHS18_001150 [Paenibacillus phyllosphaerae]|uniref:GmrSD restriction endonucleases N-terminal domain-containing protein n=1 Tax=Paenibacillus phyllosphaerae TaxID=274593 RepID=A0A7W5AUN5_9BACL|nr:DUF262 domain-containing protein [Paenibacillus phyllosphaerae]MBB3109098.1 hypothetical protein [Paenibacillus phyllosphaerae]
MQIQRQSTKITVSEFYENYLLKKYNFDPRYQRKDKVWGVEKQSFLIDTIFKNYPIPPIFLHQRVDTKTGKTRYDVIDGKQRLTAIIEFIGNMIPIPEDFSEGDESKSVLNGKYFKDIEGDVFSDFREQFWTYIIPVEYLDKVTEEMVDNIFDRLNRNGVPLNPQELRKAKYHNSHLLQVIEHLLKIDFWIERTKGLDLARMEDQEFISEILFTVLENTLFDSNQTVLDTLYEKWTKDKITEDDLETFERVTEFLKDLDLDYEKYKITGVSHIYGLWCFANYCILNDVDVHAVKDKIHNMYKRLRSKKTDDPFTQQYKKSMESRTKSRSQRVNRLNALLGFCDLNISSTD